MHPLRIAVATAGFKQPLKQSLQTAAQTGATGVQFEARNELKPQDLSDTGRRHFLHLLSELGLRVASLHLPTRRSLYDLEQLDNRIALIRAAMQFTYQLEAHVLTLRIGRLPADPVSADYQVLRQVLGDLSRYGNHVGVSLAVIPSQDAPPALQQLVTDVTEGVLAVDLDPAGLVLTGHNVSETIRTLHSSIIHMQARDALRDVDGAGIEVPLGRGEVDWTEFVATIEEVAYRGWVTVTRTQGDDRVGDTLRAVQYLKELTFQ